MPPTPRHTSAADHNNGFAFDIQDQNSILSAVVSVGAFKPQLTPDYRGTPGCSRHHFSISSSSSVALSSFSSSSSMDVFHDPWGTEISDRKISAEFERLNAIHEEELLRESKQNPIYLSAKNRCNLLKNRYNNILALERTRVRLNTYREFHLDSDYINANYIDGEIPGAQRAYICCQAPLHNTLTHFWLMVWENESSVIVMLTRLVEGQKEKAVAYWPEMEGTSRQFARFRVTLEKQRSLSTHLKIRTLRVEKEGEERVITQFHYTEWPDFGRPASTQTIRELIAALDVQRLKGQLAGLRGPIVAHCSAGVGRAGTFVAIHSSLEKMKYTRSLEVNVENTVLALRRCRPGMVQSPEQYKFIYEVLRDARLELREKAQRVFAGESGEGVGVGGIGNCCNSSLNGALLFFPSPEQREKRAKTAKRLKKSAREKEKEKERERERQHRNSNRSALSQTQVSQEMFIGRTSTSPGYSSSPTSCSPTSSFLTLSDPCTSSSSSSSSPFLLDKATCTWPLGSLTLSDSALSLLSPMSETACSTSTSASTSTSTFSSSSSAFSFSSGSMWEMGCSFNGSNNNNNANVSSMMSTTTTVVTNGTTTASLNKEKADEEEEEDESEEVARRISPSRRCVSAVSMFQTGNVSMNTKGKDRKPMKSAFEDEVERCPPLLAVERKRRLSFSSS